MEKEKVSDFEAIVVSMAADEIAKGRETVGEAVEALYLLALRDGAAESDLS